MHTKITIPEIPEEEMTPTVKALLNVLSQTINIINQQAQEIQELRDEIARLKGNKPKPKISPSKMDSDINKRVNRDKSSNKRKKGFRKRKKKLKVDKIEIIQPENIPEGSKFIDYEDYFVQDLIFQKNVIKYRRARWKTPSGGWLTGKLQETINGHFGNNLKRYIQHLNYGLNVTQHMIHEGLLDIGFDISKGMINDILIKDKDLLHEEKDLLLETGLKISPYLCTDDTGARHDGKNGYCNHIGNEYFAFFTSTNSKSRINFLKILRGKHTDYILNMDAMEYMISSKLSEEKVKRFDAFYHEERTFKDDEKWSDFLKILGIRKKDHIKIVTEAALVASIFSHGFNKEMVILSDEAGQFNVFMHALCWIHAERKIDRLIPVNDYEKKIIKDIQSQIWDLYDDLKEYKKNPCIEEQNKIYIEFDRIFTQKTEFDTINKALLAIFDIKNELLLVLKRPEIPLTNNLSEKDIRIFATKRKIHGGTRSIKGRKCRDTFLSLNKTCRKLEVSFFDFLYDRITNANNIPLLSELMELKMLENT